MRSLIAGIIVLSASMAAFGPAQAQTRHHSSPGYEYAQASIVHSGRDGPTRRTEQPGPQSYRPWSPIYNGFDTQPTEYEMNALHQQDVSGTQAREIDRLNKELLSSTNQILREYPGPAR